MEYESIIGLEIHTELNTATKMFCSCKNDPDEKHPNLNICPVCMGHPGALPVANEDAIRKVIQVGAALGGTTPEFSQFDRKNYFYPDLPKGYQISQYEHPLVSGGSINLPTRTARITRVHLEEDTGRLQHDASGTTLVDYNRAGVPLMELVTEPDIRTGEEVRQFGEKLREILRAIAVSDADMEKGQMRVEVNISLRPVGTEKFGTKVEIKNINSFKFAADAVDYEMGRQKEVLESGGEVVQETRGWNERAGESFSQRKKESSHDYRYFLEPDLPPLRFSREFVARIVGSLPELPDAKRGRFTEEYGIEAGIADILSRDRDMAEYFERVVSEVREWEASTAEKPKKPIVTLAANIITGDFLKLLHETTSAVKDTLVTPENFGEFLTYVAEEKISSAGAKVVFDAMFRTGADPSEVIREKNLLQTSNAGELEAMATRIIGANSKPVADYKAGNANSLQFLVGQMMKESKGKANPQVAQEILRKLLVGSE